jgi:predicted transcriptional regulator
VVIQGFSAAQLEEMLRTSTRNVAYEVISCLIDNGRGVLTEIIKFLTTSTNRYFVQEDSSSFLDSLQKRQNVIMPKASGQLRKPTQQVNFQGVTLAESMTEEEADGLLMQNARVKIGTAEKASTPTLNL